jgi:hypothetical protein
MPACSCRGRAPGCPLCRGRGAAFAPPSTAGEPRYCVCPAHTEWGIGRILFRDTYAEEITVVFDNRGLEIVSTKHRVVVELSADRVDPATRERLAARGAAPPTRAGDRGTGTGHPKITKRRRDDAAFVPRSPDAMPVDRSSPDVMDHERRIPGSFEGGKRR